MAANILKKKKALGCCGDGFLCCPTFLFLFLASLNINFLCIWELMLAVEPRQRNATWQMRDFYATSTFLTCILTCRKTNLNSFLLLHYSLFFSLPLFIGCALLYRELNPYLLPGRLILYVVLYLFTVHISCTYKNKGGIFLFFSFLLLYINTNVVLVYKAWNSENQPFCPRARTKK